MGVNLPVDVFGPLMRDATEIRVEALATNKDDAAGGKVMQQVNALTTLPVQA